MTQDDSRDGERIAKRLARAGVASRRVAERMIEDGRVRVNGKRIDSPALNVGPADLVEVDGVPLDPPERPRLWRYHKPAGLVTTERDEEGRATVFANLPPELPRVVSVGRLDLNSEGLLLLTNDGDLKRRLELPSTGWLRRYRVRVHGRPTEKDLAPLADGMVIDGEVFQPMEFTLDRQQGANAWLTVGLREGRNREIRRALGALGFDVGRLIRVSYGPFQLGELRAGDAEEIKAKVLRDQLGLEAWEPPAPKGQKGGAKGGARDASASLRRGGKPGAGGPADKPGGKPAAAAPARRKPAGPGMRGRDFEVSAKPGPAARGKPGGKGGRPEGARGGDKASGWSGGPARDGGGRTGGGGERGGERGGPSGGRGPARSGGGGRGPGGGDGGRGGSGGPGRGPGGPGGRGPGGGRKR
ncbi:pseudouridine synthase [Rhodovulum sp. DZ06]|uniref:pseudouridine synthase n=1 Tax=Rhodovulum sp. DZ06 TaxID=3425126 RepID=UPI003D34F2D6